MADNHTAFDAVIFDMDGLLVDSERIWHLAETDMIESRGLVYSAEVRAAIIGQRMDAAMQIFKDYYRLPQTLAELSAELVERMLKRIPTEVQQQPGAQEIIDAVREMGLPFAIASSSPMPIIDATLKAQAWDAIFTQRFSADDDERGKPYPDVYLRAARELRVEPARCLALEDSTTGTRAAVAAGMTCYAVPDTSHVQPDAFNGITPHVFGSLHEVVTRLKTQS